MKKLIFLIPFLLNASILSDLKQKELELDKQKSLKDAIETKRSWINPLILKYTYQKDNTQGFQTTTQIYSLSINQPIFKSGAIYYSIKYANKLKNYNLENIEMKKRKLIKQAYDLVFDYNILKLKRFIILKNIENAKIDLNRKKEEFLNGIRDSSDLDNAIIKLNNLKLSLADIDYQMSQIKYNFANLSSLNIQKVKLPKLKLISKDKYLNENIEINSQKTLRKIKNYLYKMQIGNQLLTISFNGSINHKNFKNRFISDTQNYYTAGVSVSIPLDINSKTKIQKTKIDYLKSNLLLQDKKIELINQYKTIISKISSLKNKIKIYKDNVKVYDNLLNSTIDSIKAGNATKLDLKTLENSKFVNILNIRILNLQIQKELLNLYYNLVTFSNK